MMKAALSLLALTVASGSLVVPGCKTEYTFRIYISDAQWANSGGTITTTFFDKDGKASGPYDVVTGPENGKMYSRKVQLSGWPTKIKFDVSNADAYSFWKLELDCWTLKVDSVNGQKGQAWPAKSCRIFDPTDCGYPGAEWSEACNWWVDRHDIGSCNADALDTITVDLNDAGVFEGMKCNIPGMFAPELVCPACPAGCERRAITGAEMVPHHSGKPDTWMIDYGWGRRSAGAGRKLLFGVGMKLPGTDGKVDRRRARTPSVDTCTAAHFTCIPEWMPKDMM